MIRRDNQWSRLMYPIALVVSGFCWFGVAGLLGRGVPILGKMWLPHLLAAVITSLGTGYVFKKPLTTWQGWRKYILPLMTLLFATTLFGFLLPVSWWLTALIKNSGHIDGEAFYFVPFMIVMYSMSVYVVLLYPLAFLTQMVLRRVPESEQVRHRESDTYDRGSKPDSFGLSDR